MKKGKLSDDQHRVMNEKTETDYAPSNRGIVWRLCGLILYIFDVCNDVRLCVQYSADEEHSYLLICTVIFIVVSIYINSFISDRMYFRDAQEEVSLNANQFPLKRYLLILIPFAHLLRCIDCLKFAWKSHQAKKKGDKEEEEKNFKLMRKEDEVLAILRVIDSFVENAPQQVLQISYLLHRMPADAVPWTFSISDLFQTALIVCPFISMTYAAISFHKEIPFTQEDKGDISKLGSAFIFCGHLLVIIPRIAMLSAMVTLFWMWTLVAIAVHWIVMTLYLPMEPQEFCKSPTVQCSWVSDRTVTYLFSAVLGIVHIFTFIPTVSGEGGLGSRFYVLCGVCTVENIVGLMIFNIFSNDSTWPAWLFSASVVFFAIGFILLEVYYLKYCPIKALSTGSEPLNIAPLHLSDVALRGTTAVEGPTHLHCVVDLSSLMVLLALIRIIK